MDLTINRESLEKFLNSVLSKIIVKPGIYLKRLQNDYCSILSPMQTKELVEVCAQYLFKLRSLCLQLTHIFVHLTTDTHGHEMCKNDLRGEYTQTFIFF